MKKILILQPDFVRHYSSEARLQFNNVISKALGNAVRNPLINKVDKRFFNPLKISITMEFLFYGELPDIIGRENVFSIDRYHPCYFEQSPSAFRFLDWQYYPSNFGFPSPTFISLAEAQSRIKEFDVVLASFYCGVEARPLLRLAKKAGLLVAILDCIDHEAVYFSKNVDPFRGYKPEEFDLFFKKDIPLWETDSRLLPLSPIPMKHIPEEVDTSDWSSRKNDIFFVGAYRTGVTRRDRYEICELLKTTFSKAEILMNTPRIYNDEHERRANQSRILLSPSGRVWDSYRHSRYGIHSLPVIIPEPDCKTLPPLYVDGENCILYKSVKRDGNVHLADQDSLISKIKYYLEDEAKSRRMGANLRRDILSGHTARHRAQYVLNCLTQATASKLIPSLAS